MSTSFWNKEYNTSSHLTLSGEPAEDLIHFARWAERNSEWYPFPKGGLVADLGCGNGRNLIYMCKSFNMNGYGVDISHTAIEQAKVVAKNTLPAILDIKLEAKSMIGEIPLPDQSVDVVLDMMASHFLNIAERDAMLAEILRTLKPYGWFFLKTFVLDGDTHAKRLIAEHPAGEPNTYIHPRIKVAEFVSTEQGLHEWLGPHFKIHKMLKSYKHVTKDGKPHKRRTISVYAEKLG